MITPEQESEAVVSALAAGSPPASEPTAEPATTLPKAAKSKAAKPPKPAKARKAKPEVEGPPLHVVLTTSRVLGPDGRSVARGRVALVPEGRAVTMLRTGQARGATDAEVAAPKLPIVDLTDLVD